MFEEIITNQARRVSTLENPTADDMMLITIDDLMEEGALKKADEEAQALLKEEAPAVQETPAEEAPAEEAEDKKEE
jgi:hypothetical protein